MTASVGVKGVVLKACQPEGLVEVKRTLWKARSRDRETRISAGTHVRVLKRNGLILTVQFLFREK